MTNYATGFCIVERTKGFAEACSWMQKKIQPEIVGPGNCSGVWSKRETEVVTSMLKNGYGIHEISATLGKTKTQIYAKKRKLTEDGVLEKETPPSEIKNLRMAKFIQLVDEGEIDIWTIANKIGCNCSNLYLYAKEIGYEIKDRKVVRS